MNKIKNCCKIITYNKKNYFLFFFIDIYCLKVYIQIYKMLKYKNKPNIKKGVKYEHNK